MKKKMKNPSSVFFFWRVRKETLEIMWVIVDGLTSQLAYENHTREVNFMT